MALFTVRPQTRPHDRARPMALGAAPERANRTVKRVSFPLHGATHNDASGHPFLHRAPQAPCDRRPAGLRPWRAACSIAGPAHPSS